MSDTPEHTRIVDLACLVYFGKKIQVWVGGKEFTLGEISALAGDFYLDPTDLTNNAVFADMKLELYKKLHPDWFEPHPAKEMEGTRKDPGTRDALQILDALNIRQDKFVDLAIRNYSHFIEGGAKGRLSFASCLAHHTDAKTHSGKDWNLAMLHEGFALHFLVDMFASGHMRTPRAAIEDYLRRGPLDSPGAASAGGEKKRLSKYWPSNAEVVGALLSLAQHDHENRKGLKCTWQAPSSESNDGVDPRPLTYNEKNKWRKSPSGIGVCKLTDYHGAFTGDGQLHALESIQATNGQGSGGPETAPAGPETAGAAPNNGSPSASLNALKHLLATVAAQVLDVWPSLVDGAVPIGDHDAFLRTVKPKLALKSDGSSANPIPWMEARGSGDETVVYWHGPNPARPFDYVDLHVETNADSSIRQVSVDIFAEKRSNVGLLLDASAWKLVKAWYITPGAAFVGVKTALNYRRASSLFGEMDGNDLRVALIFTSAECVLMFWRMFDSDAMRDAELLHHAYEGGKHFAKDLESLSKKVQEKEEIEVLKGGLELGKRVGESIVNLPGDIEQGVEKFQHDADETAKGWTFDPIMGSPYERY